MDESPSETRWPAAYVCLRGTIWLSANRDYRLQIVRWEDRIRIRSWRNAQIDVLRQSDALSVDDQDRYFHEIVRPQMNELAPDQILFSFLNQGHAIGYGGLVHIDWSNQRAEMSFLMDPERIATGHYGDDFVNFIALLMGIAFRDLGLNRVTTETYVERQEHIQALESSGFKVEGVLAEHRHTGAGFANSVLHAILRSQWLEP